MPRTIEVTLGDRTFRFAEQPHAYLTHELPAAVMGVFADTGDVSADSLMAELGEGVYEVLDVFSGRDLHKSYPRYEFHGYPTREAWENREYDSETARKSPTIPQIAEALEAGIEVNGGEFLRKVFGIVDPKDFGELAKDAIRMLTRASALRISQSSPATNGESASTISGETPPTPALT